MSLSQNSAANFALIVSQVGMWLNRDKNRLNGRSETKEEGHNKRLALPEMDIGLRRVKIIKHGLALLLHKMQEIGLFL